MRVIISGGHHNSALVIAEGLRDKGHEVIWIGHRYTMIGDAHDSLEYQEVSAKNFPFHAITAGKFHSKAHPIHWLRIPWGVVQALWLISKIKPNLVLSFGGYIAVPVALAAWINKIPIIVFEQTMAIGRANALISKFSQYNFLTWPESMIHFPFHKSQIAGLPITTEISEPLTKPWFDRTKPTIMITGGKQGSHAINQAIFPLVPKLVHDFNIIHQTGATIKTGDALESSTVKQNIPPKLRPFYFPKPHFNGSDMLTALKSSSIIISRAGAHIVYELLVLRKPAILVPLPFSYMQEQTLNAQKVVAAGLGTILDQNSLTSATLQNAIKKLPLQPKLQKSSVPTNAAEIIIDYIEYHYPHALPKKTT